MAHEPLRCVRVRAGDKIVMMSVDYAQGRDESLGEELCDLSI